jgi:hypothetical protein
MMRLRVVGMVAVLAVTAAPAFALERAQHTVDWYHTHQAERESVLKMCQNDHSYDNSADCRNATSAAHAAVADSLTSRTGKPDPEADPAYYGHDGPMIAMTLAMCSRNRAPPSWCDAARIASANLHR